MAIILTKGIAAVISYLVRLSKQLIKVEFKVLIEVEILITKIEILEERISTIKIFTAGLISKKESSRP